MTLRLYGSDAIDLFLDILYNMTSFSFYNHLRITNGRRVDIRAFSKVSRDPLSIKAKPQQKEKKFEGSCLRYIWV